MPKPIPTPDQITAINETVQGQTTMQTALNDSAALQDPEIDRATKVDQAFKDLFDWYNDKIIGKYDAEKKALNGVFVTSPVIEADIIGVGSNPPSGRLVPTPPVQDIVRIPEFDGGNTSVHSVYEQLHITNQADVEDKLVNGYGPGSYPMTLTTTTALTPSSTTLELEDTAVAITIVPNEVFIVADGGDIAVVKVVSITDTSMTPPPYTAELVIELLVPPSGTIASGATLDSFTGFTNVERTNKVASDPDYQPLMDYYIAQLESHINARKARLAEQLLALGTNEDPDGISDIAIATTNINNSDLFLTNYLLTTDISDTGLASLSSERSTRSGQITTRLAQINAAYTGQTENYYDARYSVANNRGNTSRGTLRAKSNAQGVKSNSLAMAAGLGASISALNGILPP